VLIWESTMIMEQVHVGIALLDPYYVLMDTTAKLVPLDISLETLA
jgi:hypothetical protein